MKIIAKEVLNDEYWGRRQTIRQIAEKFKVAKDTINKLLATYEIPVRNAALGPQKSTRKAL